MDAAAYRVGSKSFVPHHIPHEFLVPRRLVATDNTAAISGFSIEDQGDIRDKGGTHRKALWPCAKNSNTPYLIVCVHSTPWRSLIHVSSLPFGPRTVKVWDKHCQCPGMFFIFTLFVVSDDLHFSIMCAVGAQSHMFSVVATMEHSAEALTDPINVIVDTQGLRFSLTNGVMFYAVDDNAASSSVAHSVLDVGILACYQICYVVIEICYVLDLQ